MGQNHESHDTDDDDNGVSNGKLSYRFTWQPQSLTLRILITRPITLSCVCKFTKHKQRPRKVIMLARSELIQMTILFQSNYCLTSIFFISITALLTKAIQNDISASYRHNTEDHRYTPASLLITSAAEC